MNTSMPKLGAAPVHSINLYLNKVSIRNIGGDLCRRSVARLAECFNAYKVKSTDCHTITVGHRTRRLWRK